MFSNIQLLSHMNTGLSSKEYSCHCEQWPLCDFGLCRHQSSCKIKFMCLTSLKANSQLALPLGACSRISIPSLDSKQNEGWLQLCLDISAACGSLHQ